MVILQLLERFLIGLKYGKLFINDNVYFAHDKANIDPQGIEILKGEVALNESKREAKL